MAKKPFKIRILPLCFLTLTERNGVTSLKVEIWLNQQMKILNATADSINYQNIGHNSETLAPLKMAMKAGHFSDVYIGLPTGEIIDGADWLPPDSYDTRIKPWYLSACGMKFNLAKV